MYTTFHLSSAQEINNDIIEAIKAAFKSKPITLTIEEDCDETAFLLSNPSNKSVLLQSIEQDRKDQFVQLELDNE